MPTNGERFASLRAHRERIDGTAFDYYPHSISTDGPQSLEPTGTPVTIKGQWLEDNRGPLETLTDTLQSGDTQAAGGRELRKILVVQRSQFAELVAAETLASSDLEPTTDGRFVEPISGTVWNILRVEPGLSLGLGADRYIFALHSLNVS